MVGSLKKFKRTGSNGKIRSRNHSIARSNFRTLEDQHLIEILLPVTDNNGRHFEPAMYSRVREELTKDFGGVTAFTRAPSQGSNAAGGTVVHDDIVVMEVMAATLDPKWWAAYRKPLERDFVQEEIVIRASTICATLTNAA